MVSYFNVGRSRPTAVESDDVIAVDTNPQGATELVTAGGRIYVDTTVPETLAKLGWPPIPPPTNVTVPYVAGVGLPGDVLTCTMGIWTNEPTSYSYQWMSDENAVGAEQSNYKIADSDVGHTLTCIVTATNLGGATAAPPSNAVVVVDLKTLGAESSAPPEE